MNLIPDKAFELFDFFGAAEKELFSNSLNQRVLSKEDYLLCEGDICGSLFYLVSGSLYQYRKSSEKDNILDLHVEGEWVLNQKSLITQRPSLYAIKAFEKSDVYELTVPSLHALIEKSPIFFSIGKLFEQGGTRKLFYEESFTPLQKYEYILKEKPRLLQKFPLKMIASYLKITPETLSRVRAAIS